MLADPDVPDTLEILDVIAVRDLLEEDDFFVAVHYNIDYSVTGEPAQTAQDLFVVRLLSDDGTEQLGAVSPYPYHNTGYSQGLAGLYFDSAESLSWGTSYIVNIAGSPAWFAVPPTISYSLTGGDYSGVDGQEANQAALTTFLLGVFEDLETNWSTTLLERTDIGTVLDETGQTYASAAIPGLQALCPDIYFVRAVSADYSERDWGTDQADLYAARYDGTWVGDGMTAVADMFHVEPQLLGSLLFVLAPLVFAMVLCNRWFNDSTPALIAAPLIMACGAVLGFFSFGVYAVAVICYALFIGYVLLFRTS